MKKKLLLIALTLCLTISLIGCGNKNESSNSVNNQKTETKEVKVVVPDGLPAIASAKLIKENQEIKKNYKTTYTIEKTSENIVSSVLKGEPDIAIVPSNVAATQYNKGAGYEIAGTVGWGCFYLVSTDEEISLENLKGKEIYNIGKGLTPDIVTKSVLKDMGYGDEDFNFSYVGGVTELAPTVIAGKTPYAVLPEPALTQVSSKNDKVSIILDLNELWKEKNNSKYGFPQSTVIVKKDFADKNKEFMDEFLDKLEESCEFAEKGTEELGSLCEEIGVSASKDIIPKSMEKANIDYEGIDDTHDEYKAYFEKLNSFDASTIGGKVPDEAIFME
ncbi:MAG: ABC transporter substrate-binding protein [Clostridium sp.]|nr:ABC transporter substrate-binding protein [Clostridium sp.]